MNHEGAFPFLRNGLKDRLAAGELTLCLRTTFARTPEIAFVAQACGFDALYLDLEHATLSLDETGQICATATALGLTSLVRLPSHEDNACGRLLDAGCLGVIAPHVETADQARAVVSAVKYPPLGERSAAGAAFQFHYEGLALPEAAARTNEATAVVVMVESQEAVRNAEEIAAVEGVDLLLVGTTDLSFQLGIPGQHGHPAIVDTYQKVAAACAGHTAFGIAGIGDPSIIAGYVAMGARFVSAGRDLDFLLDGARRRVRELRTTSGNEK